ncbi:phosphatidylglycerophosphatase A [soil metagenome]
MRLNKERRIVNEGYKVGVFTDIFSSFFYTGYIPFASGTWGSLAALIVFLFPAFYNKWILLAATIVITVLGCFTSAIMMKRYGDDPAEVVIDEVAGQWLTIFIIMLFGIPSNNYIMLLTAFVSFRIFDILKLQPAKYLDELDTGTGVMLDDIAAALYAGLSAALVLFFIQKFTGS